MWYSKSAFGEGVAWGESGEDLGVACPPSCPCHPGRPTGLPLYPQHPWAGRGKETLISP